MLSFVNSFGRFWTFLIRLPLILKASSMTTHYRLAVKTRNPRLHSGFVQLPLSSTMQAPGVPPDPAKLLFDDNQLGFYPSRPPSLQLPLQIIVSAIIF